jgi:transcriptional regulator with XRE-family HTH domain
MPSYGDIVARNIRSFRSRKNIGQQMLAEKMLFLGFSAWRSQIVSKVELGQRRITADEIFGLAEALDVSLRQLLEPHADDERVEFPSGESVPVLSVKRMLDGVPDPAVTWDGVRAKFSDGPPAGQFSPPGPEDD